MQDNTIFTLLDKELQRQQNTLSLIASENYCSEQVMRAQGSVATNKYAEGYPGKRYYAGCEILDEVENLAIERAKKLFGVEYVNVQPHSGSQANLAVFQAILTPEDCFLGLNLNDGGHLSHGCKVNISGQSYHCHPYSLDPKTEHLDYDAINDLAQKHKPKLIIAGYSAYAPEIDWARFREIADGVGAYLLTDIAHIAGMVATGCYPSPVQYADVITTTTHKSLRGPRGGMIMVPRDERLAKKIDKAIFPGLQGGPMMMSIAAKAVAFHEAMQPDFVQYQNQVLENAKTMAECFMKHDFKVVSAKTQSHLFIVKLDDKSLTGKEVEAWLSSIGLLVNKNTIPGDTQSPFITSGIRIGTCGMTTRGMQAKEAEAIAKVIISAIENINNQEKQATLKAQIAKLIDEFPIYATGGMA